MEPFIEILKSFFSTWIGGVYCGGLLASTMAQNPWTWKGMEGIAGKTIAVLFWPVWLTFVIIRVFQAHKVAPAFGLPLLYAALGGGLWIIPAALFIAGAWSFYRANKQSNSGTKYYKKTVDKDGFPKREIVFSDAKFPMVKTGAFWFGVALVTASIVTLWMMLAEK